ncbi:MAG: peptidase S41, partial [Phormidesmis sp. CAN_BIN44]|nr:peptidase S41 [Phormidesmis sp. CAN_BIN44]
ITPDIKIDLTDAQRQFLATNPKLIGTKQDPQYARALVVLEQTAFAPSNQVKPLQQSLVNSVK